MTTAAKSCGFRPGGCSNIKIFTFLKADAQTKKTSFNDLRPYAAKSRGFRPGGCSNIKIFTFLKADAQTKKHPSTILDLTPLKVAADGTDKRKQMTQIKHKLFRPLQYPSTILDFTNFTNLINFINLL